MTPLKQNYLKKQFQKDLKKNFTKINLNQKKNIFITSDLTKINNLRIPKICKLDNIFKSLKTIQGKNGTIFCPTSNLNFQDKNYIFDIHKTPSYKMGSFSEYIRKKKKSFRSSHPIWSVSGLGRNAKKLTNVSRHAYGYGSPWTIMLNLNATQVNLGINPERAVTLIHHIETLYGVPYRFNKKFNCKIVKNKKIIDENFYLSVFFKNQNIKKKVELNKHFFNELRRLKKIKYTKSSFGLEMWSFKMVDFFNVAIKFFNKNIYNYLEFEPELNFHKNL